MNLRIIIGEDPDPDYDTHECETPAASMHIERRKGVWQLADAQSSNLGPVYIEIPIRYCPFCGVELR